MIFSNFRHTLKNISQGYNLISQAVHVTSVLKQTPLRFGPLLLQSLYQIVVLMNGKVLNVFEYYNCVPSNSKRVIRGKHRYSELFTNSLSQIFPVLHHFSERCFTAYSLVSPWSYSI